MESPQIRHDRYSRAPTAGLRAHEAVDSTSRDNAPNKVHKLILHYNNQIEKGNLGHDILDILFTVLCYEYQARIHSKARYTLANFDISFCKGIVDVLLNNGGNLDEKTTNLLMDILVLEMVLYSVNDEIKSIASTVAGGDETPLKIISNLIDALYLNSYIHEGHGGNQSGLIQIAEPLKKVLKPAPDANGKYFALLSSTIRKLTVTFSSQDVVDFLWSTIMADRHSNGEDKQLKLLTIALESILSVKNNINVIYVCKDEFWRLICYGLMFDVEEQRKQALYLMKKTLDYVEKEGIAVQKGSLVPFVGCQGDDVQKTAKEMQTQFLLILECLEEKQTHLVLPALTHLDNLVEFSSLHKACGNCFDQLYLHCIFKRILKHKTSSVMKKGLSHLLRMNPAMFDDEYITMLVDSLNNTSLYSSTSTDTPEIVRELTDLFVKAENSQVNLINKFICRASVCNWSYIPFFYLIESLNQTVSKLHAIQSNVWTLKEYEAVVKMIEKNITTQTPPLRQIVDENIGRILQGCAGREIGLGSIARILFALENFRDPFEADDLYPAAVLHEHDHLEYSYNSSVWSALITYVQKNVSEEEAISYFRGCCTKLGSETGAINVEYFSVIICLSGKAGKDFSASSVYRTSLRAVLDLVRNAHARPYADATVLLKVIELYTCLKKFTLYCDHMITSHQSSGINTVISPYREPVLRFIANSLKSSALPQSYSQAQLYVACLQFICNTSKNQGFDCTAEIKQLVGDAWNIICDWKGIADIEFWYALHVAAVCLRCRILPSDLTDSETDKYWLALLEERSLKIMPKSDSCDNGKIISECYEIIAELIYQYILRVFWGVSSTGRDHALLRLCGLVENGREYVIPGIVRVLNHFAFISMRRNEAHVSSEYTEALIEVSWKVLLDCKQTKLFWICSMFLLRQMVQSVFWKYPVAPSTALNYLEIWRSNAECSSTSKMLLVSAIYGRSKIEELPFEGELSLFLYTPLTWFLESNLSRTDQKIEAHLYNVFKESLGTNDYSLKIYTDLHFRLHCLMTVTQIAKGQCADMLADTLLTKLKSFEGKRYFGDSQVHRQKHRVMQLLLLNHPQWNESTVKSVHDSICHFIVHETDQPTVRVMQQWLLALIYIKNPTMQERVWELLQEGKDKRPGSITSIATVIYHVSKHLSGEEKRSFVKKAVRKLLPCCLSQQFVVRLYSQVILSKFFHEIRAESDLSTEYSMLEEALQESMQYGNLKNNSAKLSEDFLFTSFDPIENFDCQTIFYDLPRLLNMSMDECIHPSNFRDYVDSETFNVKVENSESKLSSISTPHQLSEMDRSKAGDVADLSNELDFAQNIQKKIIPEKAINPVVDEELTAVTLRSKALADGTGLIVVASLIEGMPNLGGLARTAEIFCAKELILNTLTCTQNREFQALSVSSEKWVTLSEVKPHKLQDYLLEKKASGWNLVGAEQTTSSVKLQDMIFNKKTVLLLGNEKSGIPANLIPLLDVCVEIPQAGVVRSLNVHVTGAICMWHYAKQFIF